MALTAYGHRRPEVPHGRVGKSMGSWTNDKTGRTLTVWDYGEDWPYLIEIEHNDGEVSYWEADFFQSVTDLVEVHMMDPEEN